MDKIVFALILLTYTPAPIPEDRTHSVIVGTFSSVDECKEARDQINDRRETNGLALCVTVNFGEDVTKPKIVGE